MLQKIRMILLCVALFTSSFAQADFSDTEGHKFNVKNKWIILNFWADWCASCMAEMPELNRFYKNNQNKNVVMLGVNFDHLPLELLKSSIDKSGVHFPVLMEDPAQTWDLGEISIIPATFIISPEGKVVEKIVGQSSESMLKELICEKSKTIYC